VVSPEVLRVTGTRTVSDQLDEAPTSRFHRRVVIVSGVGFFTDAYDLFGHQHRVRARNSPVEARHDGDELGFRFGDPGRLFRSPDLRSHRGHHRSQARLHDRGRDHDRRCAGRAVAPNFWFLVGARFVLGLGIGGDYPVSAVLMSEYSNRKDRGRLVGLVFSMQAVGLIVGPLVGLALLGSGVGHELSWRLMLAFGAVPAAAVIYLRSKMPESPRFSAQVMGESARAGADAESFSGGVVHGGPGPERGSDVSGYANSSSTSRC